MASHRFNLFRYYVPLILKPLFQHYLSVKSDQLDAAVLIDHIRQLPTTDRILVGPLTDINKFLDPIIRGSQDQEQINAMLAAIPELALYLEILIKEQGNSVALYLSYDATRRMYFDYVRLLNITTPPVSFERLQLQPNTTGTLRRQKYNNVKS